MGLPAWQEYPPLRIVINDPDIQCASRNGIAPVAGQVTIRAAASIRRPHASTSSPTDVEAPVSGAWSTASISVTMANWATAVKGMRSPRWCGTVRGAPRQSLAANRERHRGRPAYDVRSTASVIVCNNVSDEPTTIDLPGSGHVTFIGNVHITPVANVPGPRHRGPARREPKGVPRCLRQLLAARPELLWDALQDWISTILRQHGIFASVMSTRPGMWDVRPTGRMVHRGVAGRGHLGEGPSVRVSDAWLPGPD